LASLCSGQGWCLCIVVFYLAGLLHIVLRLESEAVGIAEAIGKGEDLAYYL
jgi:hypothetical protein